MKSTFAALFLCFFAGAALPLNSLAQVMELNVVGPRMAFGPVAVGSSAQATVGGVNNSPSTLTVYAAFGGPDAGDFSIENRCAGLEVVPGAGCSGIVRFVPRSPGPKSAELIIVLRGFPVIVPAVDDGDKLLKSQAEIPLDPSQQVTYLHIETLALSGTGM